MQCDHSQKCFCSKNCFADTFYLPFFSFFLSNLQAGIIKDWTATSISTLNYRGRKQLTFAEGKIHTQSGERVDHDVTRSFSCGNLWWRWWCMHTWIEDHRELARALDLFHDDDIWWKKKEERDENRLKSYERNLGSSSFVESMESNNIACKI